jgi:hypothetical protein
MLSRPSIRVLTWALTAATVAGLISVAAPSASATPALTGSIMYDKNDNVYVTDGVSTRQVTSDGGTPASDGTGSTGYSVPTESDDGSVVVAVRNQQVTSSGDQQRYLRGYLWVMEGYGNVIRKINPPQFAYQGTTTCGLPTNNPRGIVNAQVSADGRHIAYTFSELFETYSCTAASSYGTTVVDIDGTNPVRVDDGSGDDADLEIGSWVSNSTFLVDRGDFGSVEDYTITLPGPSGVAWFGPDDYIDGAYAQPGVRGGKLVTIGYSESSSNHVTRLWSTSGYSAAPTYRCEVGSTVNSSDVLGDPSLAPDGSAVAYQDTNSDGSISINGQGIYTMSTANNSCGTPALLVGGANDAFWSPAGTDPPPSVVIGAHPANPTNAVAAKIAFTVQPSGTSVKCSLDGGTPAGCSSPVSYSGLSNGTHTVTVTASDGTRSGSASYSWRVDTSKPTVTITAPTALAVAGSSVANNWSGVDTGSGLSYYQSQYRVASPTSDFTGWADFGQRWDPAPTFKTTVSGLTAGDTYCLRVKAVDKAANVGYSATRCFGVASDDRTMATSSHWSRISGQSYYDKTATTSSQTGASLTRTGVTLDRVGLVAKTCPGCGTVGVYVGTKLIGRISLSSGSTHYRVLEMLPPFSQRRGTVTVKVLTSGASVVVDGVVMSRA